MIADTVQDSGCLADEIDLSRALVRPIQALGAIVPSSGLERVMVRSLVEAYRRRRSMIMGALPAQAGERILGACERIPDPLASLNAKKLAPAAHRVRCGTVGALSYVSGL